MPKFLGITLYDKWAAAGGVAKRDIPNSVIAAASAQFTVENPDQNSFTFTVPLSWAGIAEIISRRVPRVWFDDNTFDEWRINKITKNALGGDGMCIVECLPPLYMLADCGVYYVTGSGGVRDFSYDLGAPVSIAQALSALVLGTPQCPSFVSVGTINPTVSVTVADKWKSPLASALAIRAAVRAQGVTCELQYRRIGSSGYALDYLAQVGAGAVVPEFRAGKNIVNYVYALNSTNQGTRIVPMGPVDATGQEGTIARARFPVQGVNAGTKRVTLYDEAGGAGPIQYNEQFVGQFSFREKTGRTFPIQHSYVATQEIELLDVSDIAAHAVTAPEWMSFRETEPNTGPRRYGQFTARFALPIEVTAVNAGTKALTLAANIIGGFPAQPAADGEWVDWQARRASFVLQDACSFSVTDQIQFSGSVASLSLGDILFLTTNAVPNYGMASVIGVVTSINTGTKIVGVAARDTSGHVVSGSGSGFHVRVYRPVGATHLVRASAHGALTITVDTVGTAAALDLIEFLQPCQGTLPFYTDSPADIAAYDLKAVPLTCLDTGECNLTPNGLQRVWTGGAASLPDGWTQTTSGAPAATNKDTAITRMGGASLYAPLSSASGADQRTVSTPPAPVHPIVGAENVSQRAKIMIDPAGWDTTATLSVAFGTVDASGTFIALATASITPPGVGPANGQLQSGVWLDVAEAGCDISQLCNERLVVKFSGNSNGAAQLAVWIDGVQITQTPTAPNAEPALLLEFSNATRLLQTGNVELAQTASPPKELTISAADFERLNPPDHVDDLITLGGNVRLVHPDFAVDETVRCLGKNPDYKVETSTQLTIAVVQPRLTGQLSIAA